MGNGNDITREFLDLKRLARYSSLSVSCLRAHIRRGSLPGYRIRGKILVKRSVFDRWVEGYRIESQQDLSAIVDDVMSEIRGGSDTLSEGHGV
ncbi:MAG: helix-turn-helix domain-containing protein [Deltaproteobacteria bacterium]|nr:helix-turn-helix domain-containing protein [Deltaproteobacteria bacterium]